MFSKSKLGFRDRSRNYSLEEIGSRRSGGKEKSEEKCPESRFPKEGVTPNEGFHRILAFLILGKKVRQLARLVTFLWGMEQSVVKICRVA